MNCRIKFQPVDSFASRCINILLKTTELVMEWPKSGDRLSRPNSDVTAFEPVTSQVEGDGVSCYVDAASETRVAASVYLWHVPYQV